MNATSNNSDGDKWNPTDQWKAYGNEYRARVFYRTPLFTRMILDAMACFEHPTVLDIGCGHGIDGELSRQTQIAQHAGQMWGCEPDTEISCNPCFHNVFPNVLERATIPADSVHVAYSSFVLEHIAEPTVFFSKIYDTLTPGGIFLSITDFRWSFFSCVSQIIEWSQLKNVYLNVLRGKRGSKRYENYPTFYRANSQSAIRKVAPSFRKYVFAHWHRFGELDYYLPKVLRPLGWGIDALSTGGLLPSQIFIMGVQK